MQFDENERIAIFIDGANLYATAKALGFDIDYKRFLLFFRTKGRLLRVSYYTAIAENQEYVSIRPLVDWLDYNGFTMVTKPTKEFTDGFGRRRMKGNMDIELTSDAMSIVERVEHIVLFTGDGDFRALVAALQQRGRRVSVVSTMRTQPPMVADELRRQADQFIDLAELEPDISRQGPGRPVRESGTWRSAGRGPEVSASRLDYPEEPEMGDQQLRGVEPTTAAAPAKETADSGVLATVTRGSEVKVKYRDPATGETWSGRGRMANWLKRKKDAGEDIDVYEV